MASELKLRSKGRIACLDSYNSRDGMGSAKIMCYSLAMSRYLLPALTVHHLLPTRLIVPLVTIAVCILTSSIAT